MRGRVGWRLPRVPELTWCRRDANAMQRPTNQRCRRQKGDASNNARRSLAEDCCSPREMENPPTRMHAVGLARTVLDCCSWTLCPCPSIDLSVCRTISAQAPRPRCAWNCLPPKQLDRRRTRGQCLFPQFAGGKQASNQPTAAFYLRHANSYVCLLSHRPT